VVAAACIAGGVNVLPVLYALLTLALGPAPIYGTVDPSVLGSCPAAIHDTFVVDGGDGWRYRTWHPQTVEVSGVRCTFAHEHGDDPARMIEPGVAAVPVRFGYIARRAGMDEPHEGFKVFVVNRGDINDEGRVSLVWSRTVFHMGTGGAKRFTEEMHSAEVRVMQPDEGLYAFTQSMFTTGTVHTVCDPRAPSPTKDVVSLKSPCRLGSTYEIWSTMGGVMRKDGSLAYKAFATPAVFDPITVFNPDNPAETVYIWDPRVDSIMVFRTDRQANRGCSRESYAQPGYWYNEGGPTVYYTDPMGMETDSADPNALRQEVSASSAIGARATDDGLNAFKLRVNHCQESSALGLRN
jgi:hypothetical protein